jgi:Concanavalin A-like lectin/glucanases superfamily
MPQKAVAIVVQNGLIHYWPMNEATGSMVQDSIGGTNLQVQNGAQLGQPGIDGFGAALDGANDFLLSSPDSLGFLESDFTVSLWMRWSSASGKPGILQMGPWALDLTFSDLRPQLLISGQGGASSSQTIADGKWHSLSVVRQGTSNLMYLDANLVGSGTGALTAPTSSVTITLGMYGAPICSAEISTTPPSLIGLSRPPRLLPLQPLCPAILTSMASTTPPTTSCGARPTALRPGTTPGAPTLVKRPAVAPVPWQTPPSPNHRRW